MVKNLMTLGAVIALLWAGTAAAATQLGGTVGSTVLTSSSNPYIVNEDIIIPAGKTLTIGEGCVFLFKPFTGIKVNGKLIVEGATPHPVVFTSINDNEYNDNHEMLPNPFDWNGILIDLSADGAVLKNFVLGFSVYGVNSQTTRFEIEGGTFRQNGQFHCRVNDKILNVADNIPFSWKPNAVDLAVIVKSDSTKAKKKNDANKTRRIIRFGGLGLGIVGVGVGTVFLAQDLKSRRIISEFEEAQHAGKDPPPGSTLENASKAYDEYLVQEKVAIVSYIVGALGLAGFTLTFFF